GRPGTRSWSAGFRCGWTSNSGPVMCGFPWLKPGLFFFPPKLTDSLIFEKPDSMSPNRLRRMHLARNTSTMPNTTTAVLPSAMPTIWEVVRRGCSSFVIPAAVSGVCVGDIRPIVVVFDDDVAAAVDDDDVTAV